MIRALAAMEFSRISIVIALAALQACAGRSAPRDRNAPIAGRCVFPAATPLPPERRPPSLALPRPGLGSCEVSVEDEDPCPPNATETEAQPTLERSRQAREMRHAGDLAGAIAMMTVHEAEDAWFRPMLRYRALLLRELGRVDEAELMLRRFLGSYGDGTSLTAPICLRNRHEIGELIDARQYRDVALTPHEFDRFTMSATSESQPQVRFLKLRRTRHEPIRSVRVSVRSDGNGCLETTRDTSELLLRNGSRDGSTASLAYLLFGPEERNAIVLAHACPRGESPVAAEPERIIDEGGAAYDRVAIACPTVTGTRALFFRPLHAPHGPCPILLRQGPVSVSPARPGS